MEIIDFPSYEEEIFYAWCVEALKNKIIASFTYQPTPFLLSEKQTYFVAKRLKTKSKIIDKHLFHKPIYTTDFFIMAENSFENFNHNLINYKPKNILLQDENTKHKPLQLYYIDTKGGFAGRNNTSAITFPLNQKWVFQKYGIYINKVEPFKFFKNTWCPEAAFLTKTGKICTSKRLNGLKKYSEL